MWWLNHVANPFVRVLLRSPLHGLLSRRLVLLRVTGRRSGRTIELPVGYAREPSGIVVTVGAARRKQWWRNIEGPTPVAVVLAGRTRAGVAELDESTAGLRVRIAWADAPGAPD
jgi:hypothetical protein